MSTTQQPKTTALEVRSIDYVPLDERHGKLWHLGPLWFMSNAQIATLAVGLISFYDGGNLIWSLISIVLGTLLGTLFMAFHSAQGPQLGLPQMIQSRPQFGYVGALLVWAFAYVQYAGFNVFNSVLAGQAMHQTVHGATKLWVVVVTVIGFVIALVGYDFIHKAEQYLTYAMLVIFGIFTVGMLVTLHYPHGAFDLSGFKWTPFLGQFGVVAGYQISWAIYVSDYSRYLPPGVTVRKTFLWTYWGSALGGGWLMVLGAMLAAWFNNADTFNAITAINQAGDKVFNGFGAIVLILAALGLVSVMALNMYGGSLTLISGIDSLKKVTPTLSMRIITIGITAVLSIVGALAATDNFLANFNNFLLLVLYLFIPWTAVNLVDYYVVRRGHYAIAEIFNPTGMYGRWGWRGLIAYGVGFVAMIPFFSVGTLFVGWIAHALGGADISLFIGLPVSGLLYWYLARTIDVAAETRVAEAEAVELEKVARQHVTPDPVTQPDAWATAADVRDGRVTAVATVADALDRIAARDRDVNACTVVLGATALAAARRVDEGEIVGPLAGVPITVKDHVWLEGAPATNGSRALAGFIAPADAACVARLRAAGAIVVAKTNNPEFCYRGVTDNELYGLTRNPRDLSRTAGGSSGGAAASVAAGMVALAIGTDGGGSIRIPSAFCGTAGLKPTFGLVPKLPGFRGWPSLSVTGPIASSVRDLALALSVMAGPSALDELTFPYPGGYLDAVHAPSWSGLRVAASADLGFALVDDDVLAAFRATLDQLSEVVVTEDHPEPADPCALWDAIALPEGHASEGPLLATAAERIGADAAAIVRAGAGSTAQQYLDAQARRGRLYRRWAEFFDHYDVLLTPSMPVTAFETGRWAPSSVAGQPVPESFDAWCALALPANLFGLPAASVPIGTGNGGLPVGIQIIGARGHDAMVLRVAALIERLAVPAFGGTSRI